MTRHRRDKEEVSEWARGISLSRASSRTKQSTFSFLFLLNQRSLVVQGTRDPDRQAEGISQTISCDSVQCSYSAIVTVSKVNNNNGRNTIAKNSQFIHAILSLKTPPADEKNEIAALKLR